MILCRLHWAFMFRWGVSRVVWVLLEEVFYGMASVLGFKMERPIVHVARLKDGNSPAQNSLTESTARTETELDDSAARYEAVASDPHNDFRAGRSPVVGTEEDEEDDDDSEEELRVVVEDDDDRDDDDNQEEFEVNIEDDTQEDTSVAKEAPTEQRTSEKSKQHLSRKALLRLKRKKKRLRDKKALKRKKRKLKNKLHKDSQEQGLLSSPQNEFSDASDITNPQYILLMNYLGVFCVMLIILSVGHTIVMILSGLKGREEVNSYASLLSLGHNTQMTFLSVGSLLAAVLLGVLLLLFEENYSVLVSIPGLSLTAFVCLPFILGGIIFGAGLTDGLPALRHKLVPYFFFTEDGTTTGKRSLNLLEVPEIIFHLLTQELSPWWVRIAGPLFVLLIECVAIYTIHIISNAACLYFATRRRLFVPPTLERLSVSKMRSPYLGASVVTVFICLYFFFTLRPWNVSDALILWSFGIVSLLIPNWRTLHLFEEGSYAERSIWSHYESLALFGMLLGSLMAHIFCGDFPLLHHFPRELREMSQILSLEGNTSSKSTQQRVEDIMQHDDFQVKEDTEPKIELDEPTLFDEEDPFNNDQPESSPQRKLKHYASVAWQMVCLPIFVSFCLGLCIALCDGTDFFTLSFVGMGTMCVESFVWIGIVLGVSLIPFPFCKKLRVL